MLCVLYDESMSMGVRPIYVEVLPRAQNRCNKGHDAREA